MDILVFGGSFDPPHKGHAALLTAAAREIDPGRILVIPAWRSPHKTRPPAPVADREAMSRLGLVEALPPRLRRRARLVTSELDAARPIFTWQTLERLSRENAGARLHFATGWDSAAAFDTWDRPATLRDLAHWWTARRPGSRGKTPSFFSILKARMPDVSSSEIRARLCVGDDASDLLVPGVARHVEKRRLYGLGLVDKLRGMLSPTRFEHSRAVARLAGALARRWDEDEELALIAGLLHDCGRSVPVPRMGAYARARRLQVPRREQTGRMNPIALHAHISEDVAKRRFGERRPEVLSAIRKHTLGDPRMSRLDRVVYVADCCSEDRRYPEAPGLRRLAFKDLDEAYAACVRNKLTWCLAEGGWIHPLTLTAWNSLLA